MLSVGRDPTSVEDSIPGHDVFKQFLSCRLQTNETHLYRGRRELHGKWSDGLWDLYDLGI